MNFAAITFSEFSRIYPDDEKNLPTTTLIALSVSKFAPSDQACAIYSELPNLVDMATTELKGTLLKLRVEKPSVTIEFFQKSRL